MKVTVRVKVYPTENMDKVMSAVEKIFDIKLEVAGDSIIGVGDNLDRLHELLRRFQILDSTRRILLNNKVGDRTYFELNKQAAYMGKLNFSSPSPLGHIEVMVEDNDIKATIDWLAPVTEEGQEVA